MIVLSRFRWSAGVLAFALVLFSSLAVESCSSKGCNAIGCTSGLTINFHGGTFDGGQPADSLQIAIENEVDQQFRPMMTCSLSLATGGEPLLCSSEREHRQVSSHTILIAATDLRRLRVTVSGAGNQISQEIFSPDYSSEEVWGEGCGTCTRATMTVQLPSS
jgi:hypothetical protein